MTYEPRRLKLVCRIVAGLVVLTFLALSFVLPDGDSTTGGTVTVGDQISFFLFGLLLASGVIALTRFRVRADASGIRVRNVFGERYFPWGVVVGVRLDDGASWASLELHDDETVALLGLQSNDGDATVDAVLALRKLLQTARTTP